MIKCMLVAGAASLALAGAAFAQTPSTGTASGLQKAQNTVNNLPSDGAVKANPAPKPDPSGQRASEYKPPQEPLVIKEPPPPAQPPK